MEPGSEFNGTKRFRLLRRIGSGGMGEVYEAFDRAHHTRVALKLLTVRKPDALLRFKHEFRALRDLEHPNLVSFGELLEEDGRWFFTMELVDGVDFFTYVRPGDAGDERPTFQLRAGGVAPALAEGSRDHPLRYDEARLRQALGQLVCGVDALHAAGKVHRDLKPSNIRVTREGRVVVLDFGLVADLDHPIHLTGVEEMVGTPAFVAPEQAGMREVGPEADWYSVGVILFLSMTGKLPIDGSTMELLLRKQQIEPLPPSAVADDVPPDLDRLCHDLLRLAPAARPRGDEILRRLAIDDSTVRAASVMSSSLWPSPTFVGRAAELARLDELVDDSRRGRASTVYIHGESGVGKSAMVRHFTDRATAEQGAEILTGTCYENELVPFKGIDGVIDALVKYMRELPRAAAAELLPSRAALLTQVFPVFRGVEAIVEAPVPLDPVRDPQELRRRAFVAVRELLARLAERRALIVVLDDMQWVDADSLALLRELMRPPESPALLLVLVVRGDPIDAASPVLPDALVMPGEVHHIDVGRLPAAEARQLAVRVLDQLAVHDEAIAQAICAEAEGHPLFIHELARRAQVADGRPGPLHLDEALWHRIESLGPEARAILEVVAVAAAPIPKAVAVRALGMEWGEFSRRAAVLRLGHLIRLSDRGHADGIEPYHDRVRTAVRSRIDAEQLRLCHHRLAIAHEASRSGDLEALTAHWRGAGDADRATRYALEAAAQAAATLAFDRAAQMYRLALELGLGDDATIRRTRILLGEALKNAGLGADAARVYLEAAVGNAPAAEKLELQRRAAEELLISGHFDDGIATLRAVLGAIGMHFPATPRRALASLLWHRAHLRVRGLGFRERDVTQVSAEELTQCDVSWSAAAGLSIVDNVRGADFQCQNLLRALHTGEPRRIARAFAIEAGHSSIDGRQRRRTTELLEAALELAVRLEDPYAVGLQRIVAGMTALLSGRWLSACTMCDEGATIMRERCMGVVWEIDTALTFALDALWFLGDLRELARRMPLRIAEAHARGDLYADINYRTGASNLLWIVEDNPAEARRQATDAMARWSRHGVHIQHYRELFGMAHVDLYAHDGLAALRRIEAGWPRLRGAMLYRIRQVHALMMDLRARATLGAAMAQRDRRPLLRAARRDARALAGEPMPWCAPAARALHAGVAAASGDEGAAAAHLREAASGFERVDMAMHAAVARRQLGRILGGDEGAALIAGADQWLHAQGAVRPDRLAAMLAPGFGDDD